ncbi:MAG: hypothetical protein Fur0044_16850 [Anaerolineae bacterium]|nr:hypothetical protein [Anaerolineales bacterium]MCQ3973633.1 hypothetical protein [Anaerolineae bacterium]
MSIGYSVEGATDRAFLEGLRRRWCPEATLIEGAFRGASHISLRRDIPKICLELAHKGAKVFVFLTDANSQDWRQVRQHESELIPSEFRHLTLYGVADRNIECWLAADRTYLAQQLGISPKVLKVDDPKDIVEKELGITRHDKREEEIASLVYNAPLHNWLKKSSSFEAFYEDARILSKQEGVSIPNERDAKMRKVNG